MGLSIDRVRALPAFALSDYEAWYNETGVQSEYQSLDTIQYLLCNVCSLLQAVMSGLGGEKAPKPATPDEIWGHARQIGNIGFGDAMEKIEASKSGVESGATQEQIETARQLTGVNFV